MSTRHGELARSAATLAGLCAIAAVGLPASCFSERATGTSLSCSGTTADPCVVEIRNFTFAPSTLRIPAGATVTWVNRDAVVHTSTSDSPGWDSGGLARDATYSRAFGTAGQFPYHCTPHPNMQATIVVE